MKLRNKIFISILLVSLSTLSISSYYLINQYHLDNVAREQERSLNELEFIRSSIENSIDIATINDDTLQLLLPRYADFYAQKGIYLMLYHYNDPVYIGFNKITSERYSDLLTVTSGTKKVQILNSSDSNYILTSGTLTQENYILVYARNIHDIYLARTNGIYLTLALAVGLILILSVLSFLYSRWITKPIDILHQGAIAVSNGNYSVRIDATKDEFNELGIAYNKMAAAVETRTKELEEKARELQNFIDDLSHEMNTPLTSIQGYSEFLINANASEEQRQKATATIQSEAKRMKDIYTKLLTLSFAREHDLELNTVKTMDLFTDIKNTFLPQLQESKINFELHSSLDVLNIDRTLIQMLLCNLVKNSLQAMQQEGWIRLSAYLEDGHTVLEVIDNGCGIPKEKIEDVMKPFFRVDKSRSRKTGGAGLGLAICKNIADLHHARLAISSEMNRGTSIKLIL